jgi:pyrroline-5-carboxylate reductase
MAINKELRIGLLGAGKMATALARGFVQQGLVKPSQVMASDPLEDARTSFTQAVGAPAIASNIDVAHHAQVLLIAVKPGQVASVLAEVRDHAAHQPLIISIAAGISLARLESSLQPGAKVVRAMPNTPALVGQGATAYALGTLASAAEGALAQKLFSTVGRAFEVKENLLDAVTGLSGSGPAFVYMVIEALSDGGVAQGLPREIATQLAAQTVLGSARMVLETSLHPGVLKDMVTSPGGTTIEGIHELEKAGIRGAFMNAVRAAAEKSRRIGQ